MGKNGQNYRLCECLLYAQGEHHTVQGRFLFWGVDYEELQGGIGHYTVAIVELENGAVVTAPASSVKFLEGSALQEENE